MLTVMYREWARNVNALGPFRDPRRYCKASVEGYWECPPPTHTQTITAGSSVSYAADTLQWRAVKAVLVSGSAHGVTGSSSEMEGGTWRLGGHMAAGGGGAAATWRLAGCGNCDD